MNDVDARVHRALAGDSRVGLLRALEVSDRPLSAWELADQVELHPSTVRSHLGVLIEAGLVASEPETRTTPGRPRVLYRPTTDGRLPARPSSAPQPQAKPGYRLLAEVLAGHLAGTSPDPAEQAATAGRAWGRYLMDRPRPFEEPTAEQARAQVLELFTGLGFAPELDEERDRILCRRCPFLDVARRHPDVVCSLHLGLLQGALDTLGSSLTAAQLEPLVEPELCVAQLSSGASS